WISTTRRNASPLGAIGPEDERRERPAEACRSFRRLLCFLEVLSPVLWIDEPVGWRSSGGGGSGGQAAGGGQGAARRPCVARPAATVIIVCGFRVGRAAHGAGMSPRPLRKQGESDGTPRQTFQRWSRRHGVFFSAGGRPESDRLRARILQRRPAAGARLHRCVASAEQAADPQGPLRRWPPD